MDHLFGLIEHVFTAEECEYIDSEEKEELIEHVISAIRLLNGYVKYLKSRKDKEWSIKR